LTQRYLLDTHTAIWLLEGNIKLSRTVQAELAKEESLAIAGISLLETAMLQARGIIALKPDPERALHEFASKFAVLPITAEVAGDAISVGLPHKDPFDRIIVATARAHNLTLVTKDRQIRNADVVPTLW
jgi:PIN domain nuclease of toxin-antitoxin system